MRRRVVAGRGLLVGALWVLAAACSSDGGDGDEPSPDVTDDGGDTTNGEAPEEPVVYDLRPEDPDNPPHPALSVAFSPDGAVLAVGSGTGEQGTVELWDPVRDPDRQANDQLATLPGHDGAVQSVAFAPDGNMLAAGTADGSVWLWDLEAQEPLTTLPHDHRQRPVAVTSVAFSPDGALLAVSTSGSQRVELETPRGALSLKVAFGSVELWNATTHEHVATLSNDHPVHEVAFSPDSRWLAGGKDRSFLGANGEDINEEVIRLWDVRTREVLAPPPGAGPGEPDEGGLHQIVAVSFSPDGRLLAGSAGKTAIVWDLVDQEIVYSFDMHDTATALAFSPDGTLLAGGGPGRRGLGPGSNHVQCWEMDADDAQSADPTDACFYAVDGPVRTVAFSPDGTLLASGNDKVSIYSDPHW